MCATTALETHALPVSEKSLGITSRRAPRAVSLAIAAVSVGYTRARARPQAGASERAVRSDRNRRFAPTGFCEET